MDSGSIWTEHVSPLIWTGFFRSNELSLGQVESPWIVPVDCPPELKTTDPQVTWITLFERDLFCGSLGHLPIMWLRSKYQKFTLEVRWCLSHRWGALASSYAGPWRRCAGRNSAVLRAAARRCPARPGPELGPPSEVCTGTSRSSLPPALDCCRWHPGFGRWPGWTQIRKSFLPEQITLDCKETTHSISYSVNIHANIK